ncbi:hypothetical protein N308_08628, partial [Struthio camelus australis]
AAMVGMPGGVEILVELVAVHLPQELGLAQLVQAVEAVVLGWRRELAQVGMEVLGVDGVESRRVVAGRRRRRKGRAAGGWRDHAGTKSVGVAWERGGRILRGEGGSGEVGAVMVLGAG